MSIEVWVEQIGSLWIAGIDVDDGYVRVALTERCKTKSEALHELKENLWGAADQAQFGIVTQHLGETS
jgi:hypothetical protein